MKLRKISEQKNEALTHLRGNWVNPILAAFIGILLGVVVQTLSFLQIYYLEVPFILLITLPWSYGFSIAFLRFIRGEKENIIQNSFLGFHNYGRAFLTQFLIGIFTLLWTLLLIVPGLIKSYAYRMACLVANDRPDLSPNQCIDESSRMMKGYKAKLFVLDLSFLGWAILGILSLGIGFLWIVPYYTATVAVFYEDLKQKTIQADQTAQATA